MTRRLKASRMNFDAGSAWHAVAVIDQDKVAAIRAHLRAGGKVPPAVVVLYEGQHLMPLDGHHRMTAWEAEEMPFETYYVLGRKFENLDIEARNADPPCRAEDLVMCDGIPAMQVAERWDDQHSYVTLGEAKAYYAQRVAEDEVRDGLEPEC